MNETSYLLTFITFDEVRENYFLSFSSCKQIKSIAAAVQHLYHTAIERFVRCVYFFLYLKMPSSFLVYGHTLRTNCTQFQMKENTQNEREKKEKKAAKQISESANVNIDQHTTPIPNDVIQLSPNAYYMRPYKICSCFPSFSSFLCVSVSVSLSLPFYPSL